MITSERWSLTLILICLGAGWGISLPLIKITVAGGYAPFAIVFYQLLIGALVLGLIQWRRLRRIPISRKSFLVWVMLAFVGTIFPNYAGFEALKVLPAGIYAVLIATIPLMAFPVALALGNEKFSSRRLLGLTIGLFGIGLIVLPDASLPDRAMLAAIPLALIAPLCYAFEGNLVARFGIGQLDPIQAMFGASVVGALITLPLAVASGQFSVPSVPFALPDLTLLASSTIHAIVYVAYVWMVQRAGPLFAVQVSYVVTASGVIWSMILLGERFSSWIWIAIAVMAVGIALVQPRRALVSAADDEDSGSVPTA